MWSETTPRRHSNRLGKGARCKAPLLEVPWLGLGFRSETRPEIARTWQAGPKVGAALGSLAASFHSEPGLRVSGAWLCGAQISCSVVSS